MSEISNKEAIEELRLIRFNLNYSVNGTHNFCPALDAAIEALQQQSTGTWKRFWEKHGKTSYGYYRCSTCGGVSELNTEHCQWCGSKNIDVEW